MSYEVIPTDIFRKELKELAKKYPAIKNDIVKLAERLKAEPHLGTALGKNCYKIRIKISGKPAGKSDGGRVITFVKLTIERVYLLSVYDKSDKATNDELDKLLRDLLGK